MSSVPKEMQGKTVLITGASSGIGKATALGLAAKGARLVLVGRDHGRLVEAARTIARETGREDSILLEAELSSLAEVRRLAADVQASVPRLDVLINNAGTIVGKRRLTVDGYEYTFALDHLSPFLLTDLLLDRLRSSAPSRIITLSSAAHFAGRMHFDDLMLEDGYRPFKAYGQAKLANVLFTYELARRLEGSRVTANCVHPGLVRTRFGNELGMAARSAMAVIRPFALGPKRGARTPIYLASSPEVEGVSGKYFAGGRARRSSAGSYDLEEARKLWEISERLTGLRTDG